MFTATHPGTDTQNEDSMKAIRRPSLQPTRLKEALVRAAPGLGKYKRLIVAMQDSLRTSRRSYAQHGEDRHALELLEELDLSSGRYVDVGANHPTDISNTYLFYRRGLQGIVVEPNPELARLFGVFRPRDVALAVGCSDRAGFACLNISKTPVLSSLTAANAGEVWKTIAVPVVPLDSITEYFAPPWIPFLSVDVEGHSGAVLRGASRTLERTFLACIEASENTAEEAEVLAALADANFAIVSRIGCNLIAINREADKFRRFRTSGATRTRTGIRDVLNVS
jgi:FkbM family methyltransferase